MSDHIRKTIDDALAELKTHEEAVLSTKKLVNQLCLFGKMPILFPNLDESQSSPTTGVTRNAFYGQPLSKCVREYLEWRRASGLTKEATLDEIMVALKQGNYDLATITKDEDGQKRGVAISLAKNTSTFHKLPNGDFGLLAWYPNAKAKKLQKAENGGSADAATESAVEPTATSPEGPIDLELADNFSASKEGPETP